MSGWRKKQIADKMKEAYMTDKQVIFEFLEDLRSSGKINMMASVPYIEHTFQLTRIEARDILIEWMESKKKGNSSLLQE